MFAICVLISACGGKNESNESPIPIPQTAKAKADKVFIAVVGNSYNGASVTITNEDGVFTTGQLTYEDQKKYADVFHGKPGRSVMTSNSTINSPGKLDKPFSITIKQHESEGGRTFEFKFTKEPIVSNEAYQFMLSYHKCKPFMKNFLSEEVMLNEEKPFKGCAVTKL